MIAAIRFSELVTVCVTISSLAQALKYNVTMFIADTPSAATKAEVFVSLTGTEGESEKKSLGSISKTTSSVISTSNLGQLKSLVIEKKQLGIFNDDNLQFLKVTVKTDAEAHQYEFVCPNPYCNIRWPNLLVKLHAGVDGQWSHWRNWRCICAENTNRRIRDRKCDDPAPYFTGAACVGSSVDTIINGCSVECRPFTRMTPKPNITTSTPSSMTTEKRENHNAASTPSLILIPGAIIVTYMLSLQS